MLALAQGYSPSPRWAQAVSLLGTTLYVHGGLSDPSNAYSYTSAPEISDLLVLDLSTSFNASSPPWQLFFTSSPPAVAWHSLSAFSDAELLLFGGQPGPNSQEVLTTLNDSSALLSTSNASRPSLLTEPQGWVNQPMRRMHHSSSYASGKVWIVGGEKADGSGNAFGEHYVFSPSGPEFTQLPFSNSSPPDIYGHASLVLPDARLLVLGGYCASCSGLVPMSTVWSLSTTTNPPAWEKLSTSSSSLPSPRRNFASAVLANGQVLIHGGGDAQLQTTYSDGWILDTGQDPMVWSNVAALEQLGERKDHFAVQAGGHVLFCFGYGSFSPASSSLFIYDPTTSSMVTSYTAPSPGSTPAIASLPSPTQTGPSPISGGGMTTASPGDGSGAPSSASGSSSGSNSRTIAIVLGTTFGILGLVAIAATTIHYIKRRHNRDGRGAGRFLPLANTESQEDALISHSQAVASRPDGQTIERDGRSGAVTDFLAHLGAHKFGSKPHQPRKDMFADEDARSFGWVGHSSSVHRQGSGGTSAWSLRSVSVLVRGVIGREPSGSEIDQGDREWEKSAHLREGGQEDFIRQGSLRSATSSHPAHRRDASLFSHTDPFEDPLPDDDYRDLKLRPGIPEKGADYDNRVLSSDETDISESPALGPQDSVWAFSERPNRLAPLRELREVSRTSLTDPDGSLPSLREPRPQESISSLADNAMSMLLADSSQTSYSLTLSRSSDPQPPISFPRYSISGSTSSHSPSISRHDSWWTRITKSPFLDRRPSITSSKPLDFRDPTPAPAVAISEEIKKSLAPSDVTPVDITVGHGRSVSSAHSGRTANTDSAEHLGGSYDVVQRLASDGSSSRRAPSLTSAEITEQGIFAGIPAPTEGILSSSFTHVDPPRSTPSPAATDSETLTIPLMPLKRGSIVSNKVRVYERKLSEGAELQKTPLHRNTRRREEVPSRTRPTIRYGIAPHPSLFVANPDLGHLS